VNQWWQPASWAGIMRRQWVICLTVALVAGGALFWVLKPAHHLVVVAGLGDKVTFSTTEQQLGAALQANGIQLGSKDQVSPSLDTSLKGKKEIAVQIQRAVPVTIEADGRTQKVETVVKTVGDLLKENNITLGPKDGLSIDPATPLTADMAIKVVRRTEETTVQQEEIPYQLVREDDRSMVIGESREVQAGEAGIKEIKKVTYYEDGKDVHSDVVSEEVVKAPVNQVVAYGTMGVVSRSGSSYRYTRELEMTASGYTAGKESNPHGNGYTYTGMKAQYGVVAVDPNVIPLYTRLYIEGYGPAIAGDIGGAIKGNRIDLCFDDLQEALDWGMRPVTVYVLGD
jgi:uncharacterized protein YabE (DUF348 family)